MTYDGTRLTPIFYSEISSSYLLFDIFDEHEDVTAAFIKEYLGLDVDILWIKREMQYPSQGTIDLFIAFTANNRRCALLIEVKVHDYLSVKENQIRDYYQAVSEDQRFDELYFIYLTQFNEKSDIDDARPPPSLDEADRGKALIEHFHHLTWEDVHTFLEEHEDKFSTEQLLMIELQRIWIIEKGETDLADNTTVTGGRSLEYYLGDVSKILAVLESLGRKRGNKLEIDLTSLNDAELDAVLKAIQDLVKSDRVDIIKKFETKEHTIQAAAEFFSEMITEREWNLLRFYTDLFHFADKNSHLWLNGKGNFSIKLEVIGKGEISLCLLRRNKLVEFKSTR